MTRKGGMDRGIFFRDGAWWIRYHDATGREHREKIGPKQLAKDVYTSRKAAIREHRYTPVKPKQISVAEMVDEYLQRRADRAGIRNLRRYAKRWKTAIGNRPLRSIEPRDVELYRVERSAKVGPQTLYHELGFFRAVFRVAIEEGLADQQPVRKLKAPRGHRVRYLEADEETRLFAALPVHYHAAVTVALHTGMRQGEQFALRWRQVDLTARVIRLPKTKSGHPRVIELNETAVDTLRSLTRALRNDAVFLNTRHQKIDAHNLSRRIFQVACAEAKVRDFRWHDLRHTFATRLVRAGVDLRTVADLLGHTSLQMVMRYAHLVPGARARAVRSLDVQGETGTGTQTGTTARGAVKK